MENEQACAALRVENTKKYNKKRREEKKREERAREEKSEGSEECGGEERKRKESGKFGIVAVGGGKRSCWDAFVLAAFGVCFGSTKKVVVGWRKLKRKIRKERQRKGGRGKVQERNAAWVTRDEVVMTAPNNNSNNNNNNNNNSNNGSRSHDIGMDSKEECCGTKDKWKECACQKHTHTHETKDFSLF